MIKHIKVNGFKTLSDFEMGLSQGLDILVGPNGAGKTNIITFFEFLGYLVTNNVADAISSAGGAGSIFKKIGKNTYESTINAIITGTARLKSKSYIYYCYDFTIKIHESGESTYFPNQRLKMKLRTVDSIDEKYIHDYDLDIQKSVDNNFVTSTKIHEFTDKIIHLTYREKRSDREEIKNRIKHMLENYINQDESIIQCLRTLARKHWNNIIRDFRGGKVFNIEPSKVKIPDDSAKPPGISKDGSGLYSTLYSIKKREETRNQQHVILSDVVIGSRLKEVSLSDIVKYTKLANEWISSIDIINYPFDKQLQIRVTITGSNKPTILPLSVMSDGTVKWITLITIILTNRNMFSIEEPENYLHPLMLAELVEIMRTYIDRDSFILMSTHSETLINNAFTHEMIVVNNINGKTIAKQISNAKELEKEIKKTGFGLGHYYLAGSIDYD